MKNIKDYMTRKEAANFLGVAANTLLAWEKKGFLPCLRNPINKYRLYCKEDLERILRLDKIIIEEK